MIRTARRTLAVQIKPDGNVVVRVPLNVSEKRINAFLAEKSEWINGHLAKISATVKQPKFSESEIKGFIAAAKRILPERTAHFAAITGVTYGRITIRRARTLWGSCTAKGNLNFNCLLAAVPDGIRDYVIVHELCHRKQMNHSRKFWAAVAEYCPEYKACRKWLKECGAEYLSRI